MYISKLILNNFKCIKGEVVVDFNTPLDECRSGLNIFVGNNNTGKSTIFEAVDFVRNGTKKELNGLLNNHSSASDFSVEMIFVGEIAAVIDNYAQPNKQNILKDLVYHEDGKQFLKIKRSSNEIKKILIWNQASNQYDNPSGIDSVIKALFELDFIWSDTNPDDISKFGASTICGKLLSEICKSFNSEALYQEFTKTHDKVFNDPTNGLQSKLMDLSKEVQNVCADQFGDLTLRFHFEELTIEKFYSNVKIKVDDGTDTDLYEKGGGLQRAFALSLLQVYANRIRNNGSECEKPFYIFIDEPEICMHPLAQYKLLESLHNLTSNTQIFINTHSPYVVKKGLVKEGIGLKINKRIDNVISVQSSENMSLFGSQSPTWGEINWYAYNLPTFEFHNELYGLIQERNECFTEKAVEDFLISCNLGKSKDWTRVKEGVPKTPYRITLQTFIRNYIHHPENTHNTVFSEQELKQSIEDMLNLIQPNNIN